MLRSSSLLETHLSSAHSSRETTIEDDTTILDPIDEAHITRTKVDSQLLVPPLSFQSVTAHRASRAYRVQTSLIFSDAFGTLEPKSMGRKILNERKGKQSDSRSSWWNGLSRILTFYLPSSLLSISITNVQSQQAFREKLSLCTIIAFIMAFIGFLTFGLNLATCVGSQRLYTTDQVFSNSSLPAFSVRGSVYTMLPDLPHSRLAPTPLLNDSQIYGNDLSFLFPPRFSSRSACSQVLGTNYKPFRCVLPGVWPADNASQVQACHDDPAYGNRHLLYANYLGELHMEFDQVISSASLIVFNDAVLDISRLEENPDILGQDFYRAVKSHVGQDATYGLVRGGYGAKAQCLTEIFKIASLTSSTLGCLLSDIILILSATVIVGIIGAKFLLALFFAYGVGWRLAIDKKHREPTLDNDETTDNQSSLPLTDKTVLIDVDLESDRKGMNAPENLPATHPLLPHGISPSSQFMLHDAKLYHTIVLVPCFSESYESLKVTLDSVATCDYPATHKLLFVVADGLVSGRGNTKMTHESLIDLMELDDNLTCTKDRTPTAYPYLSVADGDKCKNFARVYAGWYQVKSKALKDDDNVHFDSPVTKRQAGYVPMILVVKTGNETENDPYSPTRKPGNRGKRDSQFILMNFLAKMATGDRLTEFEFDLLYKIWAIGGVPIHRYETVLFIDADTRMAENVLCRMNQCFVNDLRIIGICGETLVHNKLKSWVTAIQVYEYFINHHYHKAFESVFGSVTCLPGCGTAFRIKVPKHDDQGRSILILSNPDVVHVYGQIQADSLHEKNLLLLGEDRYLTTLLLKTFPRRRLVFLPEAKFWTTVPETFSVLLSQRRRWINSTIHNLFELILVPDLCGTFCISMHFVIFMELVGTVVLPAAVVFAIVMMVRLAMGLSISSVAAFVLASVIGFPAILILASAHHPVYLLWMIVYLFATPIWHFIIPLYAFWHFDDFSWGTTRQIEGESKTAHEESEGILNLHGIYLKPWQEWMLIRNRAVSAYRENEAS